MIFTIREINRSPNLLPNITLGYRILDSCNAPTESLKNAFILLNGQDETVNNQSCVGYPTVPAIVGDAGSTRSVAVSRVIGPFGIPLVSYFSSCACLSDKKQFPTFFRTVPSDAIQVKAIVRLVKYFNWTWVGTIGADNDYGRFGIQLFLEEVHSSEVCIAFVEFFPSTVTKEKILQVVEVIKTSSAKVILAFAGEGELVPLLLELRYQNITHVQWIATEAWATSAFLWKEGYHDLLIGTVGFAIRKAEIPGLKDFLVRLGTADAYRDPILKEFWEELFGCRLNITAEQSLQKECTGLESLDKTDSVYADVSQLRVSYNVYKAVYAIAHSLHNLMKCEDKGFPPSEPCGNITKFKTWQIFQHLSEVQFTNQFGEEVSFDKNGDPIATYDLMNWQRGPNGSVHFVRIGKYDVSLALGKDLMIDESPILWHEGQQVPKSVCSESCPPGSRRAARKNEPLCCFDCVPCADGEISNETDVHLPGWVIPADLKPKTSEAEEPSSELNVLSRSTGSLSWYKKYRNVLEDYVVVQLGLTVNQIDKCPREVQPVGMHVNCVSISNILPHCCQYLDQFHTENVITNVSYWIQCHTLPVIGLCFVGYEKYFHVLKLLKSSNCHKTKEANPVPSTLTHYKSVLM
nr:PREDICTED: extracellular calcium-sensing receptor-like [Latimeria chalumnae]|eukprot:XP_014345779.1 PREDICTED: extracellular calcium-sensing receptor-like [Latimeria chalumnae]